MANNRLTVVNKTTGQRVRLAKYYPSGGWQVSNENFEKEMNEAFAVRDDLHDHPVDANFGHTDWVIEYETEEKPIAD